MTKNPLHPAARRRRGRPETPVGAELGTLPGLGPVTTARLATVGIKTPEDLRAIGAVAAYARLKFAFPRQTSLNALWALHAALEGRPWTSVTTEEKARLKSELRGATG